MVQPLTWQSRVERLTDTTAVLTLQATIEAGWHLYDVHPQENVPVVTSLMLLSHQGPGELSAEGELIRHYDEMFGAEVAYFEQSVVLRQTVLTTGADTLRGEVSYMACNDVSCMQDTYAFAVALPSSSASSSSSASRSLWWIFVAGLLAGLLAVFTPCVWPIIPMTVSFFIKRSGGKKGTTTRKAVLDALCYGLAIVLIYVGLGLLVTLAFGPSALNALSTNAVVNIIFFLLLVVFAASFFGAFELRLPDSWSNKMSDQSSKTTGFLSLLFMAFTLVLVSFSCTGPIIGTLLVEAAGRSLLSPLVGMLGFALALAAPFTLFALFPSVMQRLPKSGGWMNTFKVTLAFLELALSLKFLSVADLAYGWHLLDREVFLALWIAIFFCLGLYLLGVIAFPHDEDDHRRVSVPRFFLAVASLAFSLYMMPGLLGAPCRAISAFTPPMETQDFVLTRTVQAASDAVTPTADDAEDVLEAGLRYAEEHDMPVFLDFTGYGCVNCRKMEGAVLSLPEVEERLSHYVRITLYVDDKTRLKEELKVMENGQEKTLRTVGDKWSHLQRTAYGANAQPFYVQLDSHGEQISDSYSYNEDAAAFLRWLQY